MMTLISGDELMETPEGWSIVERCLMREFEFENFADSKSFVDKVSALCEEENHHADIHFGWGYVVIELTTHDENAITALDVKLATKINAIGG
jgi:4a-hydroxytetrahydrobiopterin dehydratase